ncbi:MAG: trypsin-like peptidase domain-containing protein [Actinomycetota bacterium]
MSDDVSEVGMNPEGLDGRADQELPPPAPPVRDQWAFGAPSAEPAGIPPARRSRRLLALAVAAIVLLGSGIGIGFGLAGDGGGSTALQTQQNPSARQTPDGLDVQAIADRVVPAVVDINTVVSSYGFGPSAEGAGTGMILTASGEVLTNNHVIEGATSIQVSIEGRSGTYAARVLGASPSADVALLQIEGVSGLPTVTLANSSSLTLGEGVVAIGNALGQGGSPTVTAGSITALDRSITVQDNRGEEDHLTGMIQTDAPISSGDSGGPLVNSSGQVVGMITAGATTDPMQSSTDLGFAIPTNSALSIVNEIRAGHATSDIIIGEVGFLGVVVGDLDTATAATLGVTSGALVVGVIPNTPAFEAGISEPAVITVIDGASITSPDTLGTALHGHKPGELVRVTWVDQIGTHTATLRLISGPAV